MLAKGLKADGPYAYNAKANLLSGYPARNEDGTINVVVEIPAGTSEKWEVSDDGSQLVRDFTGDKPRTIDYLAYPANYGLIPSTYLDPEKGGDGGALDAIVLGPALPRGTTVRALPIGVIRVIDRMEQDDKVLAIVEGGDTLQGIYDIGELDRRYPGVGEILSLWFGNAHGSGSRVNLMGTGSRGQASSVIDYAAEAYRTQQRTLRREKRDAEAAEKEK
jgi:inorganic pyrophosphatase